MSISTIMAGNSSTERRQKGGILITLAAATILTGAYFLKEDKQNNTMYPSIMDDKIKEIESSHYGRNEQNLAFYKNINKSSNFLIESIPYDFIIGGTCMGLYGLYLLGNNRRRKKEEE